MLQALITAGVVNGGLIALVLLFRGVSGKNGAAVLIGLSVLTAVAAVVLIQSGAPARFFEVALTLLAGVLVVTVTGRLIGRPPGLTTTAVWASSACLAVSAIDRFFGGDPIRPAVLVQMGFTVWAWTLYARTPGRVHDDRRLNARRRLRVALMILIGVTALHVAQIFRLILPDHPALQSLVPATVGLIFIVASAAAAIWLVGPRDLTPLNPPRDRSAEGEHLLRRLRAHLDEGARYARSGTDLQATASALGLEPAAVAERLRAGGYVGWSDYLRSVRIDHARRQLMDPKEARTSIDAIGLGCGFRSRSAFYQAFEREVGMTPGACRTQALAGKMSG